MNLNEHQRYMKLLALTSLLFLTYCKRSEPTSALHEESQQDKIVQVALVDTLHADIASLFKAMRGQGKVNTNVLPLLPKMMDVTVTEEVSFTEQKLSKYQDPESPLMDYDTVKVVYRGVLIGQKLFIFRLSDDGWSVVDTCPLTLLSGSSMAEKIRHYMDTKYYEPKRIANLNAAIDTADTIFHFIPMYAGVEKVRDAESWGDVAIGVVQIVGDAASLGLGSSVKVVRQGAVSLTFATASVRVSSAAYKSLQGTATMSDGVDALIATTEAALASVLIIKIKLPFGGKGVISSSAEAAALSHKLGRSADDIVENGLDAAELSKIGIEHKVDDAISAVTQGASRIKGPSQATYIGFIESAFQKLTSSLAIKNRNWKQAMARLWNPNVADDKAIRSIEFALENGSIKPFSRGGEGSLYILKGDGSKVLKSCHPTRMGDFSASSKGMVVYADEIAKTGELSKFIRVTKVFEIGNDYLIREFARNSIELSRALKGADDAATAAFNGLKSQLDAMNPTSPVLQKLRAKLYELNGPSGNLHWDPDTNSILLIDTLGF